MGAVVIYLVTIAFVFVVWLIASILVGSVLLPGPLTTLMRLGQEIRDPVFWTHVHISGLRVLLGLLFAFLTAIPAGLIVGSSNRLDRWFAPLIYLSYPIPKIVLLPVILLFFGLGDLSKIVLIALIIFFQLLITTRDSARQVTDEMIIVFKSLGGSRWHFFRHVVWPICLPGIFTSLRIATGIAVAVLFFAESIGTSQGLGFFIIDTWGRADYPAMFVGIMALSAIGIVLYETFDLMERKVCRWKSL